MGNSTQTKSQRKGVAPLRAFLNKVARDNAWPLLTPLPVTRDLGDRFDISNVSAFRVLAELRDRELLWQAANGRYYRAAARRLIEKPLPVACLLRRLESWTEVGREMLQGVDEACGSMDRAILLVHDRALFQQADPTSPTTSGSLEALREVLEDFLLLHGDRTSGVLLDELWPDDVLAGFEGRLKHAVVLYRRSKLPFVNSVSADTLSAARTVLDLATQRGDREIIIVSPASEYRPSIEMEQALKQEAKRRSIACRTALSPGAEFSKPFASAAGKKRTRSLIVVTEDNTAVGVLSTMRQAGWSGPENIGLVSTMGSRIAREVGITATGFDFREMGRKAALLAMESAPKSCKIAPRMFIGTTA